MHCRATLEPAATQHRIVQRVDCIQEQDHITLFLDFLECSIYFDMGFLTRAIRPAGDHLRLLIRYYPAGAPGRGHPAYREMDTEGLSNQRANAAAV